MKKHQYRPIENIIRGLDEHIQFLSDEEVRAELIACGVDSCAVIMRAKALISFSLEEEVVRHSKRAKTIKTANPSAHGFGVERRPKAVYKILFADF